MASSSTHFSELDSIELEDGTEDMGAVSHRCLIGSVLTAKPLNKQAVSTILQEAWKSRASFTISPWNDNVFLFTFEDSEDRCWVLQEAPWSIMGHLLVLQPLAVGLPISKIQFTWCSFWIQIHGLPLEKMTKANGEIIGHNLGWLLQVEAHCEGLLLYRNFLRIRVEIDVTKPLPRGFHLTRGVSSPMAGVHSWISFKYEKLSDFCFDCERIGHERTVCKFVSHDEGRASGYGPDLRTSIARSSGLPIEHYRKKVDNMEARLRLFLHRSQLPPPSSESVVAREEAPDELVANSTGIGSRLGVLARSVERASIQGVEVVESLGHSKDKGDILEQSVCTAHTSSVADLGAPVLSPVAGLRPEGHYLGGSVPLHLGPLVPARPNYFVTEPAEGLSIHAPESLPDNLDRPISIEEMSAPSSPKQVALKTLVPDDCMSIVFNSLSLKRKAPEVVEAPSRGPKLLKSSELTNISVALLEFPSPIVPKAASGRARPSPKSKTSSSIGKGRRISRVKLFDVQVEEVLLVAKEQ
ncbi:hypothetical protein ACSBR2_014204 [Camellia fascicularis]